MAKSGFFAVDPEIWADLCAEDSINPAIAFLVLCRGTGPDNSTTSWSVNAIEKHTNISRSRAKLAIEFLITNGYIKQTKKGTKPR